MLRKAKRQSGNYLKRIKIALPAALLLAGQAINVQAETGSYEMVVYENSSQGKRLIRGEFDGALSMGRKLGYGKFDQTNNQCVMLTMTKQFDAARQACDSAVELTSVPTGTFGATADDQTNRAIALTNRGVLNAMTGDLPQASADFEEAVSLSSRVKAASGNLERLRTKPVLTAAVVK